MTGGKGDVFEYVPVIQAFSQFSPRETETVTLFKCVSGVSRSTLQSSASQSVNSGWICSYFMSNEILSEFERQCSFPQMLCSGDCCGHILEFQRLKDRARGTLAWVCRGKRQWVAQGYTNALVSACGRGVRERLLDKWQSLW